MRSKLLCRFCKQSNLGEYSRANHGQMQSAGQVGLERILPDNLRQSGRRSDVTRQNGEVSGVVLVRRVFRASPVLPPRGHMRPGATRQWAVASQHFARCFPSHSLHKVRGQT